MPGVVRCMGLWVRGGAEVTKGGMHAWLSRVGLCEGISAVVTVTMRRV